MSEIVEIKQTDNITIPEAIGFWVKYKNYIYAAAIAVVSLFGGNVDRIGEFIPDQIMRDKRVDALITRVDAIEQQLQTSSHEPLIKDAIKETLKEIEADFERDYNKK